ncbi:hypothetical protein ACHAPJ_001027 [Fusarium lateritium]
MLERTAATLESRGLQRVIHSSSNRSRQLHTGFWQHGAAAIDISSSLSGPSRAAEAEALEPDTKQLQSTLLASVLMLDFLYPTSTIPLLRRLYPGLPNSQEGQPHAIVPRRRAYSSTASSYTTKTKTSNGLDIAQSTSVPTDANAVSHAEEQSELEQLEELLKLGGDRDQYQDVWELYSVIDNDQRRTIRGGVVRYLSSSHNIVETSRAISVFRQIPPEDWNESVLKAGIILLLRSDDLPSAVACFKAGLETKGQTHGLEYILADTINSRKWSIALDVWIAYYAETLRRKRDRLASLDRLQQLKSLPDQGSLYFDFRAYLVGKGAKYFNEIKNDAVSNIAFSAFRKYFAIMALHAPCPPDQAAVILETMGDAQLYNDYFVKMFDRWYLKEESRSTIQQLPAIYQKFRQLPDAVPAMPTLRGMFKISYPKNTARLDELYDDWIRIKGGLNQWGYEKFLKYHAHRGDVPTVRRLWDEYVKEYPDVLQETRGFRSIINVYSQAGDVEGARAELDNMLPTYGVQPDIDSWNTVLKGYMRTNDYDTVLNLFDEISSHLEPDSYTYAHVMAMAAKKGDLDTTLEYFQKSQEARVPITKEMGLALIVAYCQNSLLFEAESLCIEMAHRKITDTALWDQLINFNGVEGKIDKVYELLRRMREFGMEWGEETYEFLLQALVRVNQIQPAYSLLKRADEENLFLVTPEHYAIVMAGAARNEEYQLVEGLYLRLQQSKLPVTFSALVAVVSAAVKRKPGVSRTTDLGKEFVEYFRQAAEASKSTDRPATDGSTDDKDASNITRLREETHHVGRAITLLVELREFGSVEELMSLFVQIFPEYQSQDQFPPNVISALMYAHYKDEKYDEVLKLWEKTWQRVYASSRQRSGEGILPGSEYDLSRVLSVVMRAYKEKEDATGLNDTINKVTEAGFKLTRANWQHVVIYLSEMGRFERAMYWCETMLMPGWQGWNPERSTAKERRVLQNTRVLKAPKNVVYRLQQKWLEMRKMAAWSEDISRQISSVEEKYPRLYHAFTTSEIDSMPTTYVVNGKEVSARDIDKVLQSLSYHQLVKVKEQLIKQLAKEKKRETGLGIQPSARDIIDEKQWKIMLHDKVRRYARMWYNRRQTAYLDKQLAASNDVEIDGINMAPESPDDQAARERFRYWNTFWDRYDQQPHGAPRPAKRERYSDFNHHGANTKGKNRKNPKNPRPRKTSLRKA